MKKGFALTLSMLVLIFFLTLILSVESQRISVEEQTRSNHARMRALTRLLADIDSPALNYSISQLAKRSLYDVDMDVINSAEYLEEETAEEKICASFNDKFTAYLNSLKLRAEDNGLTLTYTQPSCEIELINSYTAGVSVQTDLEFKGSDAYITKSIDRTLNFSIEGIYDPLLAVESLNADPKKETKVLRPIINSSQSNDAVSSLTSLSTGLYGRGWAYGEVVDVERASSIDESEWFSKILLVSGDDLYEWKDNLNKFRGVVLIGDDSSNQVLNGEESTITDNSGCSAKIVADIWREDSPCIYCGDYGSFNIIEEKDAAGQSCTIDWNSVSGFSYDLLERDGNKVYAYDAVNPSKNSPNKGENIEINVPFIKITSNPPSSSDKVLISNLLNNKKTTDSFPPTHSNAHIYSIEDQRAAVLCGNYFSMSSGPSIFSRLEGNIGNNDGKLGLETFVVGSWATKKYSKIANEYYGKKSGDRVMGMPGCITMGMCNDPQKRGGETINEEEMSIGRFRVSNERADNYGMDKLRVE